MSDQSWYFTQNGERKGPVSLDVIKNAAAKGRLDPEKDLIWGPGLNDWTPMGQVEELQGISVTPPPVEPPAMPQPSPPSAPKAKEQPKAKAKPTDASETPDSIDDDNELAEAMAARRAQNKKGCIGKFGIIILLLLVLVIGGLIWFKISS